MSSPPRGYGVLTWQTTGDVEPRRCEIDGNHGRLCTAVDVEGTLQATTCSSTRGARSYRLAFRQKPWLPAMAERNSHYFDLRFQLVQP
jgi:hypothetical protein